MYGNRKTIFINISDAQNIFISDITVFPRIPCLDILTVYDMMS